MYSCTKKAPQVADGAGEAGDLTGELGFGTLFEEDFPDFGRFGIVHDVVVDRFVYYETFQPVIHRRNDLIDVFKFD